VEARAIIDVIIVSQSPSPFALDRGWNVVAANGALPELY
jgi:hypothetical protein